MAKIIYFTSKARGTGKTLLTVMTAIAAYKFAQQKTLRGRASLRPRIHDMKPSSLLI